MVDSILRLKVESQEYDNKLKRATEGLTRYVEECRKAGGTLEVVEKETLDYVRALGQMETTSRTATGKLAEMKKTFTELSAQYKQMTDAEKQSPFGKALAASLDQLKGRIQDSKSQLDEINKSINGGGGLTGALDNMLGKVGLNVEGLMKFGGAAGAATTALKVAKDAFFASETSLDEWGRTVQASESLYQGFLSALNNSDISGFISRMDEIVSAAREAYNAMDELGTFSAFNQRNVAKSRAGYTQALDEYKLNPTAENKQKLEQANQQVMNDLRDSHQKTEDAYQAALRQIATERIKGKELQDAFVKMFSEGNYDDLRTAKASYKSGTGLNVGAQYYYGDRVYDGRIQDRSTGKWRDMSDSEKQQFEFARALSQLNDSQIKEVQALGAQSQAIIDQIYQQDRAYNRLAGNNKGNSSKTSPQEQAAKAVADAQLAYEQAIKKAQMEFEAGTISDADLKKKTLAAQESLWSAYGKAYNTYADPKYKEAQDEAAQKIKELGGEVVASIEAQKKAQEAARQLEAAEKKLADAQTKLADAQASGDLKQIYAAEKNVQNAQKGVDLAQTSLDSLSQSVTVEVLPKWAESALNALPQEIKDKLSGKTDVPIPLTTANLDAFISHTKEKLASSDLGSGAISSLQENLSDSTAIAEIMATALKNGIDTADFSTTGLMQKLMSGKDIEDATIQSYVDQLNEKLKEKFDETEWPKVLIKFNIDKKQIEGLATQQKKEVDAMTKSWQTAASAIQGVGNVLSMLEDPTAKIIGLIAQAIASVASGAGQAIANHGGKLENGGPWAWIAFAAAATATMIGTIASIKSVTATTKRASGGFVPGTKYSGDNVIANGGTLRLDAGELVLNRAQQTNLANSLEGNVGLKDLKLYTEVDGDKLRFVLGVNNQVQGLGETLTFNM